MKPRNPISEFRWVRRLAVAVAIATLTGVAYLTLPVALGGDTTFTIVAGRSMEPTLQSGDLVITRRQSSYEVGDVVVYAIPDGSPGAGVKVIHRIVAISADGTYHLAGDNRADEDVWHPTRADVLGGQWRAIPAGGVVFLWLRSPIVIGLLVSAVGFRLSIRMIDAAATRRRLEELPTSGRIGGGSAGIRVGERGWAIRRTEARLLDYRPSDSLTTIHLR